MASFCSRMFGQRHPLFLSAHRSDIFEEISKGCLPVQACGCAFPVQSVNFRTLALERWTQRHQDPECACVEPGNTAATGSKRELCKKSLSAPSAQIGAQPLKPQLETLNRQAVCPWFFNPPLHTDSREPIFVSHGYGASSCLELPPRVKDHAM